MAPQERHRIYPRVRSVRPCRVSWQDYDVPGHTKDLSYGGVAVVLPSSLERRERDVQLVSLQENVLLRVRPVWWERTEDATTIGFRIERIEQGEELWQGLVYRPQW